MVFVCASVRIDRDQTRTIRVVDRIRNPIRSFNQRKGECMNSIVYIVGAVVIVIAILSFFGLR